MTAVLTPAVAARGIHKSFGSTRALRGVDLALAPGRCLGLVGRNGAGKSTLVSILSGLQRPDEGEVTFDGEAAPPAGAVHAWRRKLATVHQHSMIVPELTVAENVFLGRLPQRRGRRVDWRAVKTEAAAVLGEWGSGVDPARACRDLSVEQRQIVELARAVASGTKVLLLDEPTAALERDAVLRLFTRVRQLADAGVAVLYISHHLEEVFDICDEVAVLRDGELVLSAPTAELSTDGLVNAMVHGHVGGPTEAELASRASRTAVEDLPVHLETADAAAAGPVLELRALTARSEYGDVDGVSLTVAPGESVGVVGLISSGVVTLGRIAAGIESCDGGELLVGGAGLPDGDRAASLEAGVGYIPEDRRAAGFVGMLSVAENMTMSITDRLSAGRLGVLGRRRVTEAARPWAESLALVASSLAQHVADLSGGNQQKVTVARALARDPRLVVAITPTRGVDVVSKELLLQALRRAVDAGAGLLLATDELDDLGYCDRVLVLVRGRIVAEVPGGGRFDRTAMIAAIEGVTSTIGSTGAGRGATSEEPGEAQ